MFKQIFIFLMLITFSSSSFAAALTDDLTFKGVIRFKIESDFVSKTTKNDFDFTYFQLTKSFGDNLSLSFAPGIIRNSSINNTTAVKNDAQDFVLYAAYFRIKDVTKGASDLGIEVVGGQYFSTFYGMEQYYQPFKFIDKPLDFRLFPNNITPLGFMVNKNFLDDAIRTSTAYISGAGAWNGELFPAALNDNVNAGGMNVTVSFFPFIKMASSIKELSLTFNLMAIGRTSARSNYNFLLGYKYERFAASLEYAQAYSKNVSNRISAVSFSTSLDVVGPLQVLGRYDYSDIKNPAITFVPNKLDHFVLVGLNTKWFDAHFQVAATFDVNYDPSSRVETSKRFMLATQTLI